MQLIKSKKRKKEEINVRDIKNRKGMDAARRSVAGMSEEQRTRLKRLITKRHIPAVTLDARWHQLFPEERKNSQIRSLEQSVNDLLKKRGQMNMDIRDTQRVKARLVRNIVDNMEEQAGAAEELRQKRLDKSKKLMKEAKERVNQLEDQQLLIPEQLKDANAELILASVEDCYRRVDSNKGEIDEIAEWIAKTRAELKMKLARKERMEEENERIYSNLHAMLGREIMEFFDEALEEK